MKIQRFFRRFAVKSRIHGGSGLSQERQVVTRTRFQPPTEGQNPQQKALNNQSLRVLALVFWVLLPSTMGFITT